VLDRGLIVCHRAGRAWQAPPPEVHGDRRVSTQVLPPGVPSPNKAEKRLALLRIAQRDRICFPASAPLKRQEERVVAQQAVQGRAQNADRDRIRNTGNGKRVFLRNSRYHLISPLGCRDEALHFPIFFKKLIEEVLCIACSVHTPYAPGKRLSRWPSFDQAPQEGYAL
jgi:hypothetical protein